MPTRRDQREANRSESDTGLRPASRIQWALLPALFCLAPFARFYAANLDDELALAEIRWYGLVAVAAVCTTTFILELLLRPKTARLSAVVAAGVWVFFAYGELADALANRGANDALQATVWLAALCTALAFAWRFGGRVGFRRFLLLFAVSTLALPLYTLLVQSGAPAGVGAVREEADSLVDEGVWSGISVRRPDIYWFVVDSYPGRAVLTDDFHFDNRDFYRALEGHGFDVAHASHANYSKTLLSVSSTLEMTALYEPGPDGAIQRVRPSADTARHATQSSKEIIAGSNRSVAWLRQLGYRYVHFEALRFQATRCRGFEDVCLSANPPCFSEAESVLLASTPLRWLEFADAEEPESGAKAEPNERSTSGTGIPELAQGIAGLPRERPHFVYAHIYSPHGPHTNDAQCNPIQRRPMERPEDFLAQLQCVNRQLVELVEQLLRDSPDALIVLNSDHGPRMSATRGQTIFDYSPEQIREHLSILNALRLPADCRGYFEPDLTPIDTQRLVFACLGGHAPRFETDRHFVTSPRRTPPAQRRIREVEIR